MTLCSLSPSATNEYFCLDLVDNIMLLLDSTWPKVMMLSGFVRLQVKLTLELLCNTGEFWGGMEEPLSSIGVVRDADESGMNFHQLVQMLACVVCPMDTKGTLLFVTAMLPACSCFQVSG